MIAVPDNCSSSLKDDTWQYGGATSFL